MTQTVLVIGASRGLGLEFVRQYREAGCRVIATVRDEAGRDRVQALGAEPMLVDVANPASVSGLAWQLDGEKIDVALYVAGVIRRPSARTPPTREDFDAVMHTNVLGAMQALPQVAPQVEQAGGIFAFLSSTMSLIGTVPNSDSWLYRTSKAALNMAVAAAQHDYPAATLITLDPGWVKTDMGGEGAALAPEDSVRGMRQVLGSVTAADRGRLLHHDGRRAAHW
ncbi:SDR family oxidoreductase [Paracidovorax valerianellae]|uniref:NAD(P)-dependent dehydrogenase, short-chain alcohol dehydrogenase family n=1 Tax=Paracidovorax valerianellae TaxID=187868 RepID=A0A1G7CDN3_9BURK|nr:SDR family oxidoreductase [Paracidovorax valerianellae]MDA8443888.1 SDR family oxidoreductase [Paracidovorax valerianellae]SDE36830.1 NAD(P)-dependent dehydrogenase, short-chain alcohol dehydrogenase family [Paracidovorax valerianellae]